jgi:hypothetical protein
LVGLAHFLRPQAQKTGLSAPIFWLRQKDFRFYPGCMGLGDLQSKSPTSNFAKQNCDQPLAPHGLFALRAA